MRNECVGPRAAVQRIISPCVRQMAAHRRQTRDRFPFRSYRA